MTALTTKHLPINYLQEIFRHKDTALPLANGKVYFYKDSQRTEYKEIYELSGSAPNYTVTSLPNYLTLSSYGTFQDTSGNDITVYIYPYDNNGAPELYYVTVYDEDGVFQFSREAFPKLITETDEQNDLINFIPNGQFLIHNYIGEDGLVPDEAGSGVQEVSLSPNEWYFLRPQSTTSVDYITYDFFTDPILNPTGDPKYALRMKCETPNPTDEYKIIEIRFPNVNKFSSEDQEYTVGFTAKSNSGQTLPVDAQLYKNYGDGGSTAETTVLTQFTIGTSYSAYYLPFLFGENDGKTVGDNDYVSLQINIPSNFASDTSFTNFILTVGDVQVNFFPVTTDSKFLEETIGGSFAIPDYDGLNEGLPVIYTKNGLRYDDSLIGKIFPASYDVVEYGELECDGAQYEYDKYSDDGIPYKRLGDKLWLTASGRPRYGTGVDYVTGESSDTNIFNLRANKSGATTSAADGSPATGFTFNDIESGHADIYDLSGHIHDVAGKFHVYVDTLGAANSSPGAGTSGFTVTELDPGDSVNYHYVELTALAASSISGGDYFLISNTTTDYYVWFKVDAVGVDPAPGGTGILIDLLSTDTASQVAAKILPTLLGNYTCEITTVAGSTIPAGAYFNFYNPDADHYVVWYTIDDVGTKPSVSGGIYIKIEALSTDTDEDIKTKTIIAINRKYYCVPDYRGNFLRIWAHGSSADPDKDSRGNSAGGNGDGITGDNVGSTQWFEVQSHNHTIQEAQNTGAPTVASVWGITDVGPNVATNYTGGNETRPKNMYAMAIIKY